MVYCCVPMCKNKAGNSKCIFFHFPNDEKQRQLWTDRVRRINPDGSKWVPTPYSLICSYHFSRGRAQGVPDRFEWNENKHFTYASPTKQNIRRRFDAGPSELRLVHGDEKQLSASLAVSPTATARNGENNVQHSCPGNNSSESVTVPIRDSLETNQVVKSKGTRCAVAACNNTLSRTKSQLEKHDVRYHSFPKDPTVRQKWIESCRRTALSFKPASSHICSEHFTADDYERDLQAELMGTRPKKVLKKDAVPSRNLVLSYVKVLGNAASATTCPDARMGTESSHEEMSIENLQIKLVDSQAEGQGDDFQQPLIKKLKLNAVPDVTGGTVVLEGDQLLDRPSEKDSSRMTEGQSSGQVDELLSNPPDSYVQLLEKSLKSVIVPALSPDSSPGAVTARIVDLENQVMELMESNSQMESMCKQLTLDNAVLQKKLATANSKLEQKGCRANALVKELRGRTQRSCHLQKMEAAMDSLFTPAQKRLLLNPGKKVVWDKQTVAIAWTLSCISEQAYEYLRTNLKYPLPSQSTLNRTAESLKSGGQNGHSPGTLEGNVPEETDENSLVIKEEILSDVQGDDLSDVQADDLSDSQDSELVSEIKEENMSDVQDEDLSDAQEEVLPDVPAARGAIQGLSSFCEQQMECFNMMECVLEEG